VHNPEIQKPTRTEHGLNFEGSGASRIQQHANFGCRASKGQAAGDLSPKMVLDATKSTASELE